MPAHSAGDWPRRSLVDAAPRVHWLEDPVRPPGLPPLSGPESADLVVVGGGYTGLWAALRAKERDPSADVVLLEAGHCGDQASGRNGGFASASLTHGFSNGRSRWPGELDVLDRLGAENLRAIGETVRRHGIDCAWEETGELTVATAPHHVEELTVLAQEMAEAGHDVRLLDDVQVRGEVCSPTYLGGLEQPTATALVEPARLAWGLRRAVLGHGVRVYEGTVATGLEQHASAVHVRTGARSDPPAAGEVRTERVLLATSAFPPLLRRLRLRTVPVYDYVLVTEPLTPAQKASVGWTRRQGLGDASNLFHYYRLTRDDRILWGGYDAVYHYGSRISADWETGRTHELLAQHFFATFPQLEGLRFTHRWAGVIDTCTRFAAFFGTANSGRVAYALGYTGLGVAATRFGADVALDLLSGRPTERTALAMVRDQPLPFPPEPLRYAGVQLTRWSLARADARAGRRNLWLRALDAAGLGFDS
ncbi:MAG TPA: FAD-dependent oxidoreductase [Nocardioidaceae bacterium]|nr:FAD-dependent oxidoreductase [Nocardioidaceae bacterium]